MNTVTISDHSRGRSRIGRQLGGTRGAVACGWCVESRLTPAPSKSMPPSALNPVPLRGVRGLAKRQGARRASQTPGVRTFGRVLDDGCGGGGMGVSFAEEARRSSPLTRRIGSAMLASRLAPRKACATSRSPEPTGPSCLFVRRRSISCCHTRSSSTSRTRRRICTKRGACTAPGEFFFQQTPGTCRSRGASAPAERIPVPFYLFTGRKAAFARPAGMAPNRPTGSTCRGKGHRSSRWCRERGRENGRPALQGDGQKPARAHCRCWLQIPPRGSRTSAGW